MHINREENVSGVFVLEQMHCISTQGQPSFPSACFDPESLYTWCLPGWDQHRLYIPPVAAHCFLINWVQIYIVAADWASLTPCSRGGLGKGWVSRRLLSFLWATLGHPDCIPGGSLGHPLLGFCLLHRSVWMCLHLNNFVCRCAGKRGFFGLLWLSNVSVLIFHPSFPMQLNVEPSQDKSNFRWWSEFYKLILKDLHDYYSLFWDL